MLLLGSDTRGLKLKRLAFGERAYWYTAARAVEGLASSTQTTDLDLSVTTIGNKWDPVGNLEYLFPLLPSLKRLALPSIYDPNLSTTSPLRLAIVSMFSTMLSLCTSLSSLSHVFSRADCPKTVFNHISLCLSAVSTSLLSLTIDLGSLPPDDTSRELVNLLCQAVLGSGFGEGDGCGKIFVVKSTIDVVMEGEGVREKLVNKLKETRGALYNYRTTSTS